MKLDHVIASVSSTRQRCEEQEEEIRRARLGPAAADIDLLAMEILPSLGESKVELQSAGVALEIVPGFGPGTTNEPWLELICRPVGKWPSAAASARGHRVTIRCRDGNLSVSAGPVHAKMETPVERAEADEPITAGTAGQFAIEHAVSTLMADAELRSQPQPTRAMAGYPHSADAVVIAR